jgi:DNA modification methylase
MAGLHWRGEAPLLVQFQPFHKNNYLGGNVTERFNLFEGNCLEVMKTMDADSIDSIVTDPPYELGFMGKSWDSSGIAFNVKVWQEALRVLKPGGHLIAFSGSRTYHRMAVAIEDAGFEIRDQIMWVYGSGFPKSHNISKGIDKKPESLNTIEFKKWLKEQIDKSNKTRSQIDVECGFTACSYSKTDGKDYWSSNHPTQEKWETMKNVIGLSDEWDWIIPNNIEARGYIEVTGGLAGGSGNTVGNFTGKQLSDNAISPAAKQWAGWGTALKPAHEPMVLARKPLIGTVANNVLTFGVGGLNIDGSRVGRADGDDSSAGNRTATFGTQDTESGGDGSGGWEQNTAGRFPANFIHDGSDEVVALFPDTKSKSGGMGGQIPGEKIYGLGLQKQERGGFDDSGSAARFFYCAKAGKKDRNEGLDGFEEVVTGSFEGNADISNSRKIGDQPSKPNSPRANHHPTVKPTSLMQYLVRLVTPPNGIVLDPFLGSGSTGKAAMYEGFNFVGIELTPEYLPIAKARILFALKDKEGELDFEPR